MSDRPSGPEFVAKIRAALDALHDLVKRHAKRPAVLSTTFLPEIKIEGHLKNIRAIRKTAWHGGIGVPGDSFVAIMSLDELLSMLPADDDIVWTWKAEWTEALDYILSLLPTPTTPPLNQTNIRDAATESRDKFIYDEWQKGTPEPQIRGQIKNTKGWSPLSTKQATKQAAQRYAKRNRLPPPTARKEGRKKKTTPPC